MRYIDYLKMYTEMSVWIYSMGIVGIALICYFRSIPIMSIPIGSIAQAVGITFFVSFGHWWFESSKK
jgi:hypothetical protein